MHFWFNQSKKLDNFIQRPDMSDEEFLHKTQLSGELARKIVECCRRELGKAFKLSPEKLYPDDKFLDIISLPTPEWDMMYLVLPLEEALGIGIGEEQVPNWTTESITLGEWISDFFSRCTQQKSDL